MLPIPSLMFSPEDRKSTRLNSSHTIISYAVFCLKKQQKRDKNPGNDDDGEPSRGRPCLVAHRTCGPCSTHTETMHHLETSPTLFVFFFFKRRGHPGNLPPSPPPPLSG